MTRIRFADVTFPAANAPREYEVAARLRRFLTNYRIRTGSSENTHLLSDRDRDRIDRHAQAYLLARDRKSGMGHLDKRDREKLSALRLGAELRGIQSEHEADVVASMIHQEMPWMAAATERVWQEMRASVQRGDPAPRLSPVLLLGPPGIGKSHWARLLAEQLRVPTCMVDATNEPASFSIVGSQRGWSSTGPGRPLQTILATSVANPIVVIDEVEKAGSAEGQSGTSYSLSQALLPLLERSTATSWTCPYFRVQFDMSWVNWVLTANTLGGLPRPFLSRVPPIEMPALSLEHLLGFAERQGKNRDLPNEAIDAVREVISTVQVPQLLSLRSILRMIDRLKQQADRPTLH